MFALILLGSAHAVAQEGDRDEEARALFEAGLNAYEAGRFEIALRHFRAAYEASHRSALLFNIGQAADRARDDQAALEAFEEYLRLDPDSERAPMVRTRVAALRAALSEGREATETEPSPDPAASGGGGPDLAGPIALLAGAGAGLVLYAIMGGLTLAENDRVATTCGSMSTATCSDDELGDLHTFSIVADVGWITAALAGSAGVAWLIVALSADGEDSPAVQVRPLVGPTTAGLWVGGGF